MTPWSLLVVVSLVAGVVSLVVAGYAWRRRSEPGAIAFVALMSTSALWALSYGVALTIHGEELRRTLEVVVWAGRVGMPVAWLAFGLAYTGRGRIVTPKLVVLASLSPAATLVLIWTNPEGLVWTGYEVVVRDGAALATYEYGPWLWWQITYAYVLIGVGAGLLVEPLLAADGLYTGQGAALLGSVVVGVTANLLWLFEMGPVPEADLTPAAMTIVGILFAIALFRYRLLGSSPAVWLLGQRSIIEHLGEGVVVLDNDGRIVDLNRETERLLGQDRDEVLERPFVELVDADIPLEEGTIQVQLDTQTGHRQFEIAIGAITDGRHERIGYSLVLHDVTEREQRSQRLDVLTRALRHNIRNDLNLVAGCADELVDHTSGRAAELAEAVREQTDDLLRMGEKAGTVQGLLDTAGPPKPVDLERLATATVEEIRAENPATAVAVSVPDDLQVVTYPILLKAALRNAVENAVEHSSTNARSSTRENVVEVVAERDDEEWVVLTVTDDGPGIPDHELTPVSTGTETALQHASGIGLWLIRWGTEALGGKVTFDTSEDGTAVRLHVPDLQAADHEPRPVR